MKPRTFILLILVLIVFAIAVILGITAVSGGLSSFLGNDVTETNPPVESAQEPGIPTPSATPALQPVVVAKVRLPVGEILSDAVMDIEMRPITNVALVGGYSFTSTAQLEGKILKAEVASGQEILQPMLALNATDLSAFGSDLALYVPSGEIAVAFPIDPLSGVAYAMRPGDKVDVIMTVRTVPLDPEFQSSLTNYLELIDPQALVLGEDFLFPKIADGRLEFIEELNQVGVLIPNELDDPIANLDVIPGLPIPKRVTQLTIQQADVLYVGEWVDPRRLEREQEAAQAAIAATAQAAAEGGGEDGGGAPVSLATPTPIPSRLEDNPTMVIISLSAQDALTLKYARERGVDIDLVLRSPGDQTVFVTTSVNLLQMVDQGAIAPPLTPAEIDLFNPILSPTRQLPDG